MPIEEDTAEGTPERSGWRGLAAIAAVFPVLLLVFAGLTYAVARHGSVAFDQPVMVWVHSVSTPWLATAAQAALKLGGLVVPAMAGLIALVLCVLRRVGDAALVVAAELGASRLNSTFKSLFERARPDYWEHLSIESTHSFPSGHAMATMAVASALLVVTWGARYWWVGLVVAVVYVGAVGASRVILGVHFPSDVLAGWCLSLLWVGFLSVILRLVTAVITRRAPRLAKWI